MTRDIMGVISQMIKQSLGYSTYSNEVAREFKLPCFFITIIPTTTRVNFNAVRKDVSVVLSFLQDNYNLMESAKVYDDLTLLFYEGIKVKGRYLHTEFIDMGFSGENDETMQVTLKFSYLEAIKHVDNSELAGSVDIVINRKDVE